MMSVLLVAVLIVVATTWVRGTRRNRQRWLRQLDLPGVWVSDDTGDEVTLEFEGDFDHGRYRATFADAPVEGRWQLHGDTLELQSEDSPVTYATPAPAQSRLSRCDLILFDTGRIGLHGNGFEHRVFNKTPAPAQKTSPVADNNVVPLRRTRDH